MPTDGRPATDLAVERVFGTDNVVVFDLVHDWGSVSHAGIAVADQAGPDSASRAAGLFQAIGCSVSRVDDTPGLVVMRTVAQLAAVAADAVNEGVGSAADVDIAMRLGTNYPSGPLEWADRLGADRIATVLDNMHAGYGEDRYRVPVKIRRHAATGHPLTSGRNGSGGSDG
jgi:3-hydroxybutyryl-CoA dehydrogenase